MKKLVVGLALAACIALPVAAAPAPAPAGGWTMNATVIEACSSPAFCQCYFNSEPAAHGEHGGPGGHFCKFNNAFHINHGVYGTTKLDGAKFWVAGDLGGDFSKGMMDWAVVTFDRATSKDQRAAIGAMLGSVYPVKWNSLTTSEADMAWTPGKDEAWATLDGGRTAEVRLKRAATGMKGQPVVIKNLQYWGAAGNEGFIVMPNTVEAYRTGDKAFEFHGTNGFMITLDAHGQVAPAAPASGTSGR